MKKTLEIELVPSSSWGDNLRKELSASKWRKLSISCSDRAGGRCEVCGTKPRNRRPDCHEIWEYDDVKKVQRLVGLVALCTTCHKAKHLGRTLSVESAEVRDRVLMKLMKMNEMSVDELEAYIIEVFKKYEERSRHKWTVDTSWLERG